MLVLFDHVTPAGIARFLPAHTVTKAKDRGWDTLTNGDLLAEAERAGFDVLLTGDKNMPSAEPSRPEDRPYGIEHSAMACCSIAHRKNCGRRGRCRARQLHRGEPTGIRKRRIQIGAPPSQRMSATLMANLTDVLNDG
jgi:hypothetical protein